MFDKVYCINLDDRTDRWEECQEEFKKLKWPVERFRGFAPVNLAYISCIKQASEGSSLILEDDVTFFDLSHLDEALSALPEDWDLVSFGANLPLYHHRKVSNHLYVYENGWATHAVGYSSKMAKWMVDNFDPMGGLIYDEWMRLYVLPKFKCFIVKPMVATQRASFSDIRGRFVDYTQVFLDSQNKLV